MSIPASTRQPDPLLPEQRLFHMITGFAVSRAIYVAAKLGMADLLHAGPKASDDLADALGVNRGALGRLLRLLVSAGVVSEDDDGRFALTTLGAPLRSGAPGSLQTWAIFWGEEWVWRPWGELLYSVRTGLPAFDHIYGMGTFEYFAANPEASEIFTRSLRAQAEMTTAAVMAAYDFSRFGHIVDVGGQDGSFLAAVLKANRRARGTLFDQPHVIERARGLMAGLEDRCRLVPGDFFAEVPAGGDAYILKLVVHDWDDSQAITILRNIRRQTTRDGRLLMIEHIIRPGLSTDLVPLMDVQMLVRQRGRERAEREYRDLLAEAGFTVTRVAPTRSSVSVIEAVPTEDHD